MKTTDKLIITAAIWLWITTIALALSAIWIADYSSYSSIGSTFTQGDYIGLSDKLNQSAWVFGACATGVSSIPLVRTIIKDT